MMKNKCFVDTTCWIALLNKDDQLHQIANSEYKRLMKSGYRFITTTGVLNELANSLCQLEFRTKVTEFYKKIKRSSRVGIIFVDKKLWNSGWQLYEGRTDKSWSLTDCISIIVMQQRELIEVLTNDRHFTQAGFIALLREK